MAYLHNNKYLNNVLISGIPGILSILLSIFYYVLQKRIVGLLKIITKFIEFSGYYFTYKLHKKKVSKKSKSLSLNNFAIVIQGPNVLNSNFTLETLRYYSTQYPKSPIIFSSWEHDINIIKTDIYID